MSQLLQLYRRAKYSPSDSVENFTTEALAACIRNDWRPMATALHRASLVSDLGGVTRIGAETQVYVEDAGILDIVLEVSLAAGRRVLWVEAKVRAAESGDQIQRYLAALSARPLVGRPALVLLGRHDIREGRALGFLPWQFIYDAIGTGHPSPYWRDFRRYLEEIHMADEFDSSVTAREAASLHDAFRLFRKAERILLPVAQFAQKTWPVGKWPDDAGAVRKALAKEFIIDGKGRYTIGIKPNFLSWPWIGFFPEPEGEASIGVHVNQDPKHGDARTRILEQVRVGKLPDHWRRSAEGWTTLKTMQLLRLFEDHEEAVDWLKERVQELADAGIFSLLPQLGAPASAPEAPAESEGEDEMSETDAASEGPPSGS